MYDGQEICAYLFLKQARSLLTLMLPFLSAIVPNLCSAFVRIQTRRPEIMRNTNFLQTKLLGTPINASPFLYGRLGEYGILVIRQRSAHVAPDRWAGRLLKFKNYL